MASWHKQLEEAARDGAEFSLRREGSTPPRSGPGNMASDRAGNATGPGAAMMSREAFASAALMLDLAFARARSEVGYVLELGHAHRGISAVGSISGDHVWLRMGTATLRFVYSRRARVLVVSAPGKPDEQIRWSPSERALTGADGRRIDLTTYLDAALETTIRAWKADPHSEQGLGDPGGDRAPMPTLADEQETPLTRKESKG